MDTRLPYLPKTRRQALRIPVLELSQISDLQTWLPHTIIVMSILAAAIFYLWPSPREFPMDDSYIHIVYAENLAKYGKLFFNTPDEIGLGTSSLLWVLLLAAGNFTGLSLFPLAKVVGLASLAAVGIGIYYLLLPFFSPWKAMACSLLVILSGHMIWFALSGMETMLFLALGILGLLCYRQERWRYLGITLGLLAITRLEGLLLLLVIAVFDIWRWRSIRKGLLIASGVTVLICFPWILYLQLRTGFFLPTSGIGKHFSSNIATQIAAGRIESLSWLSTFPALLYPFMWIGYAIEFILGGSALPAPYFKIDSGVGPLSVKFSAWAIPALALVVFPLLWKSNQRLVLYLKTHSLKNATPRTVLLIFLFWTILHNLSYMVYLPSIGTASRYASLNHIALWLALGFGVSYVYRCWMRYILAAGLTILALVNTFYWNQVYDANLEHMLRVRLAAAAYLHDKIDENEICAAFDVGALRYYGEQPLVDLGGLIDPNLIHWFRTDRLDQYLLNRDVSCLLVPGRSGTEADGLVDILKESGLRDSNLFETRPMEVFEMDRERWLLGYLPTNNYQATVTIYRLEKLAEGGGS